MIVDYVYPVEDDAVASVTLRTVYQWVSEAAAPGWQISAVGEKYICARARDDKTSLCL